MRRTGRAEWDFESCIVASVLGPLRTIIVSARAGLLRGHCKVRYHVLLSCPKLSPSYANGSQDNIDESYHAAALDTRLDANIKQNKLFRA